MKLLPTTTLSSRIMAARPRLPSVFRRASKQRQCKDGSVTTKTTKKGKKKKSPTSSTSTATSTAIASSPFELSLAKAYNNKSIISELDDSDMTKDTVLTSSALTSSALTSSALDVNNEEDDEFVRLYSDQSSDVSLLDALQEHDDECEYDQEGDQQEKGPSSAVSASRPQESSSSTRRLLTFIDQRPTSSSSSNPPSLVTHVYTRPRTSLQENQMLFYNENDYIRFRRESEQEDLCAALLSMTTLSSNNAEEIGFVTGSPWVLDSSSSDENSSCGCSPCSSRRPTEQDEDDEQEDEDADSIWDNAILEDLTPDHSNLSLQMDQRMSSFSSMSYNDRRRPRSQARSNSLHRQAVLQHF